MDKTNFTKIKKNLQCFSRPIYETLITTLMEMIDSGELPAGTKFPPDKKLAQELGISHVTLARALNELRRRNILERRRAHGTFVPKVIDSEIALKARKKIAVVFDFASEKTFQQELFLQLHHGLEQLNCNMMFFSSDNDSAKQQQQLLEILEDISISGCIVWSILSQEEADEVLKKRPRYYPLIFLDKHYYGLEHDAVVYDNFACGTAVGKSLKRKKIKHCYWISKKSDKNFSSVVERYEGFLAADVSKMQLQIIDFSKDNGDILPKFKLENSAIVCADSNTAQMLKQTAAEKQIELPKCLATFETVADDHSLIPEFTAYRFPCELGNEAIKILASRLNGKELCTVNHSGKWSVLGAKTKLSKKR